MLHRTVLPVLLLATVLGWAVAPRPALAQSATPVRGNPEAPVGGVRRDRFPVQPHTLHPLNATDRYGNLVLDYLYETLAETDPQTLEHVPRLAEGWEISDDHKTFTFHLDPDARWRNGEPVTARDVKFSFDVLFHKTLKTRGKWQAYFANFERVEVVDKRTVRFHAKRDHFLNFVNIAGLRIVPASGFPGDDPNDTPLAKQPRGSGPYRLVSWDKGSSLRLARRQDYWGADLPLNRGRYNVETILTKIVQADTVALEALKKGELDVLELSPEQWVREATGEKFGEGPGTGAPIVKLDVQNQAPRPYRYVGWNLSSPLFSDERVRRAMGHLFDRETFIDKFFFGMHTKAVGPFAANSDYTSPRVAPLDFSVKKALALLREAGWGDSDGDRVLDKDGRPLRFTIMTADPETSVKMLTLAKQSMRRAGVDMNIKLVDWTSLLQLIDEYKFDAVMLGWTRSPFPDPTALWHSRSAVRGGLNFVRYRNEEVDALIDKAVQASTPQAERVKLYRRIHERIHRDQPYTFLLEPAHQLYAYRAKFAVPRPYFAYDVGMDYWWVPQPRR